MLCADNSIGNFGLYIVGETLKMNQTLTSLDIRGEWINKEIKKNEWMKKINE